MTKEPWNKIGKSSLSVNRWGKEKTGEKSRNGYPCVRICPVDVRCQIFHVITFGAGGTFKIKYFHRK